ncbi:MAG: hypothetical protein M5U34_46085 [Chloroflexi bacterium]|nr:hypothetical protein [Chloroflexota bacterium]
MVWLLLAVLGLATLACGSGGGNGENIPNDALVVEVVSSASLAPWLTTAVSHFNASSPTTSSDQPIYVVVQGVESGQQVSNMAEGGSLPALVDSRQPGVGQPGRRSGSHQLPK